MNLMRQRDDLKAACEARVINSGMLNMALASPVFQWWSGNMERTQRHEKGQPLDDQENEFINTYLMESIHVESEGPDKPAGDVVWPRFTPYPCFRIAYMDAPIYEQWWATDKAVVCLHCDDEWSMKKVKVWSLHVKTKQALGYWKLRVWVNGIDTNLSSINWDGRKPDEIVEHRFGKIGLKFSREYLCDYAANVVNMLGVFMFDIYGSGNTVVKVSPKPDVTKSVQWRQAREHYLVLRRQQVERMRETKGHATDEDIIRAAHWRRAHLRRLSSHKFINKRGLLVPVKRAWIGPEEWEGKDGKVYTVVGLAPPPLTGIS